MMLRPPVRLRTLSVLMATAWLAVACTAHASVDWRPSEGTLPPGGDFHGEWIRAQLKFGGPGTRLMTDEELLTRLLKGYPPGDPYQPRARKIPTGFESPAWSRAITWMLQAGHMTTSGKARDVLAWDLGLYRAYPHDVARPDIYTHTIADPLVMANLVKAGVSGDIASQALKLIGYEHYAIAANYAVAVQLLTDLAGRLPQERHATWGVRDAVVTRFMAAQSTHDLPDGDWDYLIRRLRGRADGWKAGELSMYGERQITPALRVARVAAAYREEIGHVGPPPCAPTGVVTGVALVEAWPDICSTDANDRAVHRRYREVLAQQAQPMGSRAHPWPARLAHVIEPVVRHKPLWHGMFGEHAADHEAHAEVLALLLANQHPDDPFLDDAAAKLIAESVSRHMCEAKP